MKYLEGLCEDDAVCFIAYRHHVTPQRLLRGFLAGELSCEGRGGVRSDAPIFLEPNEMEILKAIIQ
ncbi:unknown [Alistipes sp. CAG:831]|nr:unknown [Alistipes sp. CAG:831]